MDIQSRGAPQCGMHTPDFFASRISGGDRRIFTRQILPHIRIAATCWIFGGAKNNKGYGNIRINGRNGRTVRTHKWMFEALNGPIRSDLMCDHLCRNRACCNPAHIEAVNAKTNALRGFGQGALNASKTHCPYGHPYTSENTRITYGRRRCRICQRKARNLARTSRKHDI